MKNHVKSLLVELIEYPLMLVVVFNVVFELDLLGIDSVDDPNILGRELWGLGV